MTGVKDGLAKVLVVGRTLSLAKRREETRRGGVENVAELWKMTIEFRDWTVHRSPHGEGEEGTDRGRRIHAHGKEGRKEG